MTWNEFIHKLIVIRKKNEALSKCSKNKLNINNVNAYFSLQVAKYNKNDFQNLQDLIETGEGLVMFNFKLGYAEEQLFVAVSVTSNKNGSFMVDV